VAATTNDDRARWPALARDYRGTGGNPCV